MYSYGGVVNEKDLIPKLEELNTSLKTVIGQVHTNVTILNDEIDKAALVLERMDKRINSIRRLVLGTIIIAAVAVASVALLILTL